MWALEERRSGEHGASPAGVVLVERRPARAVTLAGALGACLALVPLFVAPEPGAVRFLTFVALAASGGALVFLGWSRPRRVELVRKQGGLSWGDEPLPPAAYVALGGGSTEEPPAYRALIGWNDGRERVALERDDPAGVLADALELAQRLDLDLRPAWGLERHFPAPGFKKAWESVAGQSPESGVTTTGPVDFPLWPIQRRVAAITLIAGLFVLVVTAALIRSPYRSVAPSALALTLPAFAAGLTLAIGAFFLGIRRRLELSTDGIVSTSVLFGFPLGKPHTLGPAAARVHGVTPDGGPVRHVLFATTSGPVSVTADPEGAELIQVRAGGLSAPEAPLPELPLATSRGFQGPDRPARLRS